MARFEILHPENFIFIFTPGICPIFRTNQKFDRMYRFCPSMVHPRFTVYPIAYKLFVHLFDCVYLNVVLRQVFESFVRSNFPHTIPLLLSLVSILSWRAQNVCYCC